MTVVSLLNSGADVQTEDWVSWLYSLAEVYTMSILLMLGKVPFYMYSGTSDNGPSQ